MKHCGERLKEILADKIREFDVTGTEGYYAVIIVGDGEGHHICIATDSPERLKPNLEHIMEGLLKVNREATKHFA